MQHIALRNGKEFDDRLFTREFTNHLNHLKNGGALATASKVDDFKSRKALLKGCNRAQCYVIDVCEITRLLAVTEELDFLSSQAPFSKAKRGHIGTSSRSVHREIPQTVRQTHANGCSVAQSLRAQLGSGVRGNGGSYIQVSRKGIGSPAYREEVLACTTWVTPCFSHGLQEGRRIPGR